MLINKESGDWEVPATLNRTWGYKKDDTGWKTPEDLTFKLVVIVSKGGNYLLNVGPTAEGVIPQASQDNLRAVGRWLKINAFFTELVELARLADDRGVHELIGQLLKS